MGNKKKARQASRREQRKRKEPVNLMFAFGSNLSFEQMKLRCPDAEPYRKLYLPNGRLVFRAVADAEFCEGSLLPGGLWKITPACERSLDIYEGVFNKVYTKKYLVMRIKSEGNKPVRVLYYKMNEKGIMPPTEEYINRIAQGYRDFGLDLAYLDEALSRAWDDKAPSRNLRDRHTIRGKPTLARPFFPTAFDDAEKIIDIDA